MKKRFIALLTAAVLLLTAFMPNPNPTTTDAPEILKSLAGLQRGVKLTDKVATIHEAISVLRYLAGVRSGGDTTTTTAPVTTTLPLITTTTPVATTLPGTTTTASVTSFAYFICPSCGFWRSTVANQPCTLFCDIATTTVGATTSAPTTTTPPLLEPLSEELQARIMRDWLSRRGADDEFIGGMYLGTYGDSVAMAFFYGWQMADPPHIRIGDYIFQYRGSNTLWIWNDGEFFQLANRSNPELGAYRMGLLTDDDIPILHYHFRRLYWWD